MRLKITAAAALALAAAAALAACGPQDGSAPAANSARQSATPATASNAAAAAGPSAPAASATPAATPPATPSDGIRRVTIAESRALAERGDAVIYDVRDQQSFAANRISGAKLVPLMEVSARAAEFPKDKLIITYCA